MNERGHELGNPGVTDGRDLPWLQDVDDDGDGKSDHWLGSWDYAYRDVVIVDVNNQPVDVYNLTTHNLADEANRATFTQMLIDAAEANVSDSWTNPNQTLDVNDDTFISPFDALAVINVLNSIGPHELGARSEADYYLDTSGDGFVSPLDALLVLNYLNENSSVTMAAVAADPSAETTGQLDSSSIESAVEVAARPVSSNPISSDPISSDSISQQDSASLAAAIDAVWADEQSGNPVRR